MASSYMQMQVGRKVIWHSAMSGPLHGVITRVIDRWKYEVRFTQVLVTKADGTEVYTRACRARTLKLL